MGHSDSYHKAVYGLTGLLVGGSILQSYCAVQEAFNMSVGEWQEICQNSIDGSWCTEERKGEMHKAMKKFLESS